MYYRPLIYSHAGGIGDLDFLTADLGSLNVGGMAPMGAPMGGIGGAPPFGMDTGLSADLFGLQTGSLSSGKGPVVLPNQASVVVIIDH